MTSNISAITGSTYETLFQQNHEQDHEIMIDFDELLKCCPISNTDESIFPEKKPEIPTVFCNDPSKNKKTKIFPKNRKNAINKERKNLFKKYKIDKPKKNKVKTRKQNYDNFKRIKGNTQQNSYYEFPKNYKKFDAVNESEPYDDIEYDKYGIQTFTGESRKIISTQQIIKNPDLSEENSITNDIVISPFNSLIFKETNSKYKSNKFDEPLFISFDYILKNFKKYIEKLWSKENQIFKNEIDFNYTLKNGIIYQHVYKLLSENIKYYDKNRKFDADAMIIKIKTQLQDSILNYINSFDVMKYCEIYKLKKELINKEIEAHFNLIYLTQELYNIFSNDSSNTNKNTNKDKILEIKNQNFSFFKKHFCLTIQKCLDIFRYKEQNLQFKNKLVEFLIKEYTNFKGNITAKQDYIASLILLAYNFERFFYLRLPRYLKSKAK